MGQSTTRPPNNSLTVAGSQGKNSGLICLLLKGGERNAGVSDLVGCLIKRSHPGSVGDIAVSFLGE
jgi:hypothetical protein